MYYLSVTKWFSAAHYLPLYDGKCKNMHGHNWKVEVTVKSIDLPTNGMLIDFRELKSMIDPLLPDHEVINDTLKMENPTAENLAKYIFDGVESALNQRTIYNIEVHDVEIWEGRDSCAIYQGE